jgi:hypothetical protein
LSATPSARAAKARDSPIKSGEQAGQLMFALARDVDIPAIRFSGNFGRQPTVQDSCAHQILSALRGAVPI